MPDPLSQEILDQLPEDFQIEIADLPDSAQDQVIDAVQAAADEGALQDLDIDRTVADAENVVDRQEVVEELREQQAEAVEAGDYDTARDVASQQEWQIREIQDDGGEGDEQLVQAEQDQANLDEADYRQEIGDDQVEWAADQAEAGNLEGAEATMVQAGYSYEAAGDYGGAADAGGVDADYSYDAGTDVDTSTAE